MKTELKRPVPAAELAHMLGLRLAGVGREIRELQTLESLLDHGLSFVLNGKPVPGGLAGTVFGAEALAVNGLSVICTEEPRLDFIRAQHILSAAPGFLDHAEPPEVHPSVRVGRNSVIENGVSIGEGTRVGSGVIILGGTRIGRHCEIKAGAVIGESGFGFERDEGNLPLKMLHLGGVSIGDHVEIGSLSTVCRGALGDTVLEDHVKLDDHVHVAHNCRVGAGTTIAACAELSGSVRIGRNCWISPNCSLLQKLAIGDGSFVGIGAVVLRPTEPGARVFGNPAKKVTGGAPAVYDPLRPGEPPAGPG